MSGFKDYQYEDADDFSADARTTDWTYRRKTRKKPAIRWPETLKVGLYLV